RNKTLAFRRRGPGFFIWDFKNFQEICYMFALSKSKLKILFCWGLLNLIVFSGISVKAEEFPERLVDDFGEVVRIDKKPERIISLSPANTEILFAIGAGDKVVGITSYCNYPPRVEKIDRIGGFTTPNIEAIVAKEPDLVIASYGNGEENIKKLRELGITVLSLRARSLEDVLKDILLVGKATGYTSQAEELAGNLKIRIEAVKKKAERIPDDKKPRILYLVWYPELWVAGKGTFADGLIKIAGGKNVASDLDGWKIMSKEAFIRKDPQIILCSGMGKNSFFLKEKICRDPDLKIVSALKDNQVFTIYSDIVERPGPRVVDGLEKISFYIQNWWQNRKGKNGKN
ncbi:ABC transporter substrate-binding protein, partial [Candidatus Aerophobetes bacterium]|nr:ABC transporter substrate-binding protein [Candidatus Aerophobetes bacterium]